MDWLLLLYYAYVAKKLGAPLCDVLLGIEWIAAPQSCWGW